MKIMVCGHGRHGKDQFCEFLGLPFVSSSEVALDEIIWPDWGRKIYNTKEGCFLDRANYRSEWAAMINGYNTPDKAKLARLIYRDNDVYCGIRNREEFLAAKEEGLFDMSIWVDAFERHPQHDTTCKVFKSDCDIIVTNNGTLDELKEKAANLAKALGIGQPSVKDLVVEWADEVFPDRTITNAISKMMLEEIPEYMMSQHDPLELADLGILLYDIAHLAGVDLDDAIRRKMEINKKRTWAINKTTGLMSHEEPWKPGEYCSHCDVTIMSHNWHFTSCAHYSPFQGEEK
jgi:hypothetical protein